MALTFAIGGLVSPVFFALSCLTGLAFALLVWQLIWLVAAVRQSGPGLTAAAIPNAVLAISAKYAGLQRLRLRGAPPTPPPSPAPPGADNAPDQSR